MIQKSQVIAWLITFFHDSYFNDKKFRTNLRKSPELIRDFLIKNIRDIESLAHTHFFFFNKGEKIEMEFDEEFVGEMIEALQKRFFFVKFVSVSDIEDI